MGVGVVRVVRLLRRRRGRRVPARHGEGWDRSGEDDDGRASRVSLGGATGGDGDESGIGVRARVETHGRRAKRGEGLVQD